jgi:hypothetical protein
LSQEFRLPLIVADSLLIYALHRWDRNLQAAKQEQAQQAAHQADVQHEGTKRHLQAQKAEQRAQRKAQEQRAKEGGGKHAQTIPVNIVQPDKSKSKKLM